MPALNTHEARLLRPLLYSLTALSLMLSACSDEPVLAGPAPAPVALPASCEDPAAVITLRTTAGQPDWLLFARQSGGGDIQFNRTSIRRCGDNEAEITIRVRYTQAQLYAATEGNFETTVRYHVEHVRYRYRCAASEFTVLDRSIVNEDGAIVATIPGRADLWRPTREGSPAALIMPTACNGR